MASRSGRTRAVASTEAARPVSTTIPRTARKAPVARSTRVKLKDEDELVNGLRILTVTDDPVANAAKVPAPTIRKTPARRVANTATGSSTVGKPSARLMNPSTPPKRTQGVTKVTLKPVNGVGTTANAGSGTTAAKPPAKAPARTTSKVTAGPSRPKAAPTPSATVITEPWATEEDMPASERAVAAMTVINAKVKSLSSVIASGYKFSPDSTSKECKADDGNTWDDRSVRVVLDYTAKALEVLRKLDEEGALGAKGMEVDRASQALISKLILINMHRQALEVMVPMRQSLLRRYNHVPLSQSPSTGPAPVASSSRVTLPSKASTKTGICPQEWLDLTRMPAPAEGEELGDTLKTVICQFVASAWVCLLVVGVNQSDIEDLMPVPTISPSSSLRQYANPLLLASELPMIASSGLVAILYRQLRLELQQNPLSIHLHRLTLYTLASAITTSEPASKTTPGQLWETTHRNLASTLNDDKSPARLQEVAETLSDLVGWTELLIEKRSNVASTWFSGNQWSALLEFWITIARRSRDVEMIDRALRLMKTTAYTSSETTPPPRTPPQKVAQTTPSTPAHTQTRPLVVSRPSSKGKKSDASILDEISRACGDMSRAEVIVEKMLSDPTALSIAAVESAVKSINLRSLADSLNSLGDDSPGQAALSKASRSLERIRRLILQTFTNQQSGAGKTQPTPTLLAATQHWLVEYVDLAEDLLQGPLDLRAIVINLGTGAIDTLQGLSRSTVGSSTTSSLAFLDRGARVVSLSTPLVPSMTTADWLRCLSSNAYTVATQFWQKKNYAQSQIYGQRSCDLGLEAMTILHAERAKDKNVKDEYFAQLEEQLCRRYEMVGICHYKLGDSTSAWKTYFEAMATVSRSSIAKLEADLERLPFSEAFAGCPMVISLIDRLGILAQIDPSVPLGQISSCAAALSREGMSAVVIGGILERLVERAVENDSRVEMASVAVEIGDFVLGIYTPGTMPLRRMRLLIKSAMILGQSGSEAARLQEILAELEELAITADFGDDRALSSYKAELVATTRLLQVFQAYFTSDGSSSAAIQDLARSAMADLRQILTPPSIPNTSAKGKVLVKNLTSTPPKKPFGPIKTVPVPGRAVRTGSRTVSEAKAPVKPVQRKVASKAKDESSMVKPVPKPPTLVFDDVQRLTRLLASLTSLMGLLGHVFAKIEALKLYRAVLRQFEDRANDYVAASSQLAFEYFKLGKYSRSKAVFAQAQQRVAEASTPVSAHVRVEMLLRQSISLAMTNDCSAAETMYDQAESLARTIDSAEQTGRMMGKVIARYEAVHRASLAGSALAAIAMAQNDHVGTLNHLINAYKGFSRCAKVVCMVAPKQQLPESASTSAAKVSDDPFTAPQIAKGADEPSKDAQTAMAESPFQDKHLSGFQWSTAEDLIMIQLALSDAYATRGNADTAQHMITSLEPMLPMIKAPVIAARMATKSAELKYRMRQYDQSVEKLGEASNVLQSNNDLDMIDIKRIQGDVYSKQEMAEEAGAMFDGACQEVTGLEAVFTTVEAILPSPKKAARISVSTSTRGGKDTLLPSALAKVLRQQAWLLRENGLAEDCDKLMLELRDMSPTPNSKAEELYLDGRISLQEAFEHFKSDLWMSSLTDSTIAMPMGNPEQRTRDRQSSRRHIQIILHKSEQAFMSSLNLAYGSGRVEDVRQSCLSLALLRAFQTSLGEGSAATTASAAALLASTTAITISRDVAAAIDHKFDSLEPEDRIWPEVDGKAPTEPQDGSPSKSGGSNAALGRSDIKSDVALREYWQGIRAKYATNSFLSTSDPDLSSLPDHWAVVSINVTEDRNTMFVSRHQKGRNPIVFTLPLDRQGKREGEEDDMFTFETAVEQMTAIINESNDNARSAKTVDSQAGRMAWWAKRHELDKRLQELLANLEYCWLGAFKTILSPKLGLTKAALTTFRNRLERVFTSALTSGASELKKGARVHLDDALLECFAGLSSKCKDEEAEDLVYFILDIYQFHGVPVALAELDIDQLGVDVKSALAEVEPSLPGNSTSEAEHLFLALDKNVSGFPWESIPILRGRPVIRTPSLPFLLDQVELTRAMSIPTTPDDKRLVDSRKVFYILNASGDLTRTQTFFEPWIKSMCEKAGWKGITGRPPTELEMLAALQDYDLVLYFGHGGAEQYIRSFKVKHLAKCATMMLWGCSSGHLKDMGDFDRSGTAWNYMVGGCPSMVANLWDVTDRDIDRLSEDVFKHLNLDSGHVSTLSPTGNRLKLPLSKMSTAEAVAQGREECKLKYLTGAAPVVYGLPMYLY